ncbi:hypothetical protein GWK47_016610 [Chionoecetes opilio]|uniref:Uncharacterized protein n=1 Tax=Chionoecetes opilio TaxID=41210 RepID=A0A8J4XRE4_CHIOP|nr:hypothetical protein GWK47_016610 [Chionoecetes opilio]
MSWLLDGKGLEVLYKAQVRSAMEYACFGWGGAANKHLALLDKVQGRAVRLIRDSGAGQEPRLHSFQHRRDVAGLTVMYKVHQQRVPHLHTLRHPLRRAQVTTRAIALTPAELLQPRCRTWHHQGPFVYVYVGWWNALLASQPRLGAAAAQCDGITDRTKRKRLEKLLNLSLKTNGRAAISNWIASPGMPGPSPGGLGVWGRRGCIAGAEAYIDSLSGDL